MSRRAVPLLPLLALAAAGCGGEPRTIAYDLARLAEVADVSGDWTIVRLGTVEGQRFQAAGFEVAPAAGAGRPALARRLCSFRLRLEQPALRTAVLDLEPLEGDTRLGVRLNGRRVARFDLTPGRRRYALALPAEWQEKGDNSLELRFDEGVPTPEGRYAARVFNLAVRDGAVPADPPPLFEVQGDAVTAVAGSLVYGIVVPGNAEVRLGVQAGADGRASLSWAPDGGAETTVWTRQLRAGTVRDDVRVTLPAASAAAGRLRLAFTAPVGTVTWRAPRVLGRGVAAGLEPLPFTREEEARAEPLRRSLEGAPLVLVVMDAARARQLGAYGYGRRTSPRVDALAAQAVVFERAHTSAVFTLAAMSSLWTSLPPARHHAGVPYDAPLPAEHTTLAEVLAAGGYKTAAFVGNTRAGAAYGLSRGFADYREAQAQASGAGTAGLVQAARAWLREHRADRFFLYVHLREPHFPFDPPSPFSSLFGPDGPLPAEARRDPQWYRAVNQGRTITPDEVEDLVRAYDRNLAYADAMVGELLAELRAVGLEGKALVAVTADHGEALYEHGFISHNEQVFEESTHVPLVLRLPDAAGLRGVRVRELVDTTDIPATLADAAGVRARARGFRGRSLLPLLKGASGRPAVVSRSAGEESRYAVLMPRYKCVVDTRSGAEQLFDLQADPAERHDRGAAEPGRLLQCRQALHRLLLDQRPERAATARPAELSPQQLENLRALGYVE